METIESTPSTRRIHRLNDQLANQIAAGEVVERPGAALKELVENSLDAGATEIRIEIRGGGIEKIEVADNGSGIHEEDLILAVDRHATSKIQKTEDLFAIATWGFRGEALASIAAVSRFQISSRTANSQTGRELLLEGGKLLSSQTVARPVGTTVKVEDLFYNTPARRKFLKSQGAETSFCLQTLHRLALTNSALNLELHLDGEKEFHYLPSSSMSNRVAEVYREAWGVEVQEQELNLVEATSKPLHLQAWILPSKEFIPSSRGIITFVNHRIVKDKLLQQAILSAAKEVLFGNLYPQLVLFLEMPAEMVDVNVHPTKSEVRFRDSNHVFAFVRKHIERALAEQKSIHLSSWEPPLSTPENTLGFSSQNAQNTPVTTFFSTGNTPEPSEGVAIWSEGNSNQTNPETTSPFLLTSAVQFAQKAAAPMPSLDSTYRGPQFLGTLRNTYLVCQDEKGLLLVDQHAAHERIIYEKLKKHRLTQKSQPLLIPIHVELPKQILDRWELDELKHFAEYGLHLDRTGPTLLSVREVPADLVKKDGSPLLAIGPFLRELAKVDPLEFTDDKLAEKLQEKILHSLATTSCHGSVRAGQNLSPQEAYALLSQMQETDFSGHCPHGRPTTVRFTWSEIERLFKRLV